MEWTIRADEFHFHLKWHSHLSGRKSVIQQFFSITISFFPLNSHDCLDSFEHPSIFLGN